MFQIHSQHVDTASGFHVIKLKNPESGKEHIVQIAIGADSCPMCGGVYPRFNLAEIDPKAMIATVIDGLTKSHQSQLDYAKKHNLRVK